MENGDARIWIRRSLGLSAPSMEPRPLEILGLYRDDAGFSGGVPCPAFDFDEKRHAFPAERFATPLCSRRFVSPRFILLLGHLGVQFPIDGADQDQHYFPPCFLRPDFDRNGLAGVPVRWMFTGCGKKRKCLG